MWMITTLNGINYVYYGNWFPNENPMTGLVYI